MLEALLAQPAVKIIVGVIALPGPNPLTLLALGVRHLLSTSEEGEPYVWPTEEESQAKFERDLAMFQDGYDRGLIDIKVYTQAIKAVYSLRQRELEHLIHIAHG